MNIYYYSIPGISNQTSNREPSETTDKVRFFQATFTVLYSEKHLVLIIANKI